MSICFFAVPASANAAHQKHLIRQKPVCVLRFTPKQRTRFPAARHDVAMQRRLAVYNMKEELDADS